MLSAEADRYDPYTSFGIGTFFSELVDRAKQGLVAKMDKNERFLTCFLFVSSAIFVGGLGMAALLHFISGSNFVHFDNNFY